LNQKNSLLHGLQILRTTIRRWNPEVIYISFWKTVDFIHPASQQKVCVWRAIPAPAQHPSDQQIASLFHHGCHVYDFRYALALAIMHGFHPNSSGQDFFRH
jgi:hypothetical protein